MTLNLETLPSTSHPLSINPIDFRFSLEFFNQIPNSSGVYWMQDSRRNILFVGASQQLRIDLLSFKNLNWKTSPEYIQELCQRVKQIDWNSTETFQSAQDMKKIMVRQFHPQFNKRQKAAAPLALTLSARSPSVVQMMWGELTDLRPDSTHTIFGPYYGKNALHRVYSALVRWTWIVGNSQSPEQIPPQLLKPLLRNGLEISINQVLFENQHWINSLSRFLKGYSDLFLDFGLRKIEKMNSENLVKIQCELLEEDLVLLDRFFKRYSDINVATPIPSS